MLSSNQPSVAPDTTHQEDLTHEGQRTINLIWETTQAKIALAVVYATLAINGLATLGLIIFNKDLTTGQSIGLSFLNFICGIVVGFYFSRTNHAAIGGIGPKPQQEYKGR